MRTGVLQQVEPSIFQTAENLRNDSAFRAPQDRPTPSIQTIYIAGMRVGVVRDAVRHVSL